MSVAHTSPEITSAVKKLLELLGQHILQARNAPPEITDLISIYISLGSSKVFVSGPFVQPTGPGMICLHIGLGYCLGFCFSQSALAG